VAAKGQPKSGGRKKGTPNKATADVAEKLKALGVDSISGMARIAQKAEEDATQADKLKDRLECRKLAGNMYAELAQYEFPKRKAVELGAGEGQKVTLVIEG
jgi:hypothetical protein